MSAFENLEVYVVWHDETGEKQAACLIAAPDEALASLHSRLPLHYSIYEHVWFEVVA